MRWLEPVRTTHPEAAFGEHPGFGNGRQVVPGPGQTDPVRAVDVVQQWVGAGGPALERGAKPGGQPGQKEFDSMVPMPVTVAALLARWP